MRNITARVRNYIAKDGTTKGEFVKIGAIGNKNGKDFVLLDPSVNLAGVLIKQNVMSINEGKEANTSIMCSVFENTYDSATQPQQAQSQQAPQQQAPTMPNPDEFIDDQEIPF